MQVNWQKILIALGCDLTKPELLEEQPCPLHPQGEHTLVIRENPCTGFWEFHCEHPKCKFSGDAIALVAKKKNITIEEAVNLFRPGGAFNHLVIGGLSEEQLDEYLRARDSQGRIAAYLNTCRQALRQDNARGYQTQQILTKRGYLHPAFTNFPDSLGLLVQEDLPPALKRFQLLKYKKGHYVIYPYTYNGRITQLKIQNLDNLTVAQETFGISQYTHGIFLEENINENTEEVYIAGSELSALAVVRTMADMSDDKFPVICTESHPLPYCYRNLKRIYLLSTEEAPLTLKQALNYFVTDELVAGNPDIKTYTLPVRTPLKQLSAQQLMAFTDTTHRFSVHRWIIREIEDCLESNRQEHVYQAFAETRIPEAKKDLLLKHASGSEHLREIQQLLDAAASSQRNTFTLANGNQIKRTLEGIMTAPVNGEPKCLCNVRITIDEILTTNSGQIQYTCELRAKDMKVPAIRALIPEEAFTGSQRLHDALRKAFLAHDLNPYVGCYEVNGYQWRDILARLSEGLTPRKEITKLGVTEELELQLPNLVIAPLKGKILPQNRIFTISEKVLELYKGLDVNEETNFKDAFRNLLSIQDNVYVLGFIAGISHLIHQVTAGYVAAKNGKSFAPSHLFYVEPEYGLWGNIYKQLSQMFTGAAYEHQLPATNIRGHLKEIAQLGNLPYFAKIPPLSPRAIEQAIYDAPVGLISPLDWRNACVVTDDARTTFVVAPDHNEQPSELDAADLAELQRLLPSLLLEMLAAPLTTEESYELFTTTTPAITGYKRLCRVLEVEPYKQFDTIVQNYYTAMVFTGAGSFFHSLYELVYGKGDKNCDISVIEAMPMAGEFKQAEPAEVYLLEDRVLVSHKLVEIVNLHRKCVMKFSARSLTAEFEKENYLRDKPDWLTVDEKRYWTLDREVWEKYVMKKPIQLEPVSSGKVIQLTRIA